MPAGMRTCDFYGVLNVRHWRSYVQSQNLIIGYVSMWDEYVNGAAVCHIYSNYTAPSDRAISINWCSFGYTG